jgi:hypothetical protein
MSTTEEEARWGSERTNELIEPKKEKGKILKSIGEGVSRVREGMGNAASTIYNVPKKIYKKYDDMKYSEKPFISNIPAIFGLKGGKRKTRKTKKSNRKTRKNRKTHK